MTDRGWGPPAAIIVALLVVALVLHWLRSRRTYGSAAVPPSLVENVSATAEAVPEDAAQSPRPAAGMSLESSLGLQLYKMTQVIDSLSNSGSLDAETTSRISAVFDRIEHELEGATPDAAKKLRWVLEAVRGTLRMRAGNLTAEEVEKAGSLTYASAEYWDTYYKSAPDERYDWLCEWDDAIGELDFTPLVAGTTGAGFGEKDELPSPSRALRVGDLLLPYIKAAASVGSSPQVLMLGCGNSEMPERLYREGFPDIVNIDSSENVLATMRNRLGASLPHMRWELMNASRLDFGTGSFDVIIDKSTLDALESNAALLAEAIGEARRVLRPGGVLLSITFNGPQLRLERQLQRHASWSACRSHPFVKIGDTGKRGEQLYVHACFAAGDAAARERNS